MMVFSSQWRINGPLESLEIYRQVTLLQEYNFFFMKKAKHDDRAFGRFETVLRLYWDGVPIPPFTNTERCCSCRTFDFKRIGYSMDYRGETEEICCATEPLKMPGFTPLCMYGNPTTTLSCRVGCHYSPLVGTFVYCDIPSTAAYKPHAIEKSVIRIPVELCEIPDVSEDPIGWEYRKYLRTVRFVELYYPLVKQYVPLDRQSLRRIIHLATTGMDASFKDCIVQEACYVKEEFVCAESTAIYYYMCMNPTFRRVLAPLQLLTEPNRRHLRTITLPLSERSISRARFQASRDALQDSLLWSVKTRSYFCAMKDSWDTKFSQLIIMDLSTSHPMTSAGTFLQQIVSVMQAAFTRIRIGFYSHVEELFFSHVDDSRTILFMSEEEVLISHFHRLFTATQVFLINNIRRLVLDGIGDLINFLNCDGLLGRRIGRQMAARHPLLEVELVLGDNQQPRSPAFSRFSLGVSGLFDDIFRNVNGLPHVEAVILRTLNMKCGTLNAFSYFELACFRSTVNVVFDAVRAEIDDISARYAKYATPPAVNMRITRTGEFEEIKEHLAYLHRCVDEVRRITPNFVYCGCFAINCTAVRKQYSDNWEMSLQRFMDALHTATFVVINEVNSRCTPVTEALRRTPQSVDELEKYYGKQKTAMELLSSVRNQECLGVINRISCMERLQIPISHELYDAAVKMMAWPRMLTDDIANAPAIVSRCKPVLKRHLNKLRAKTRDRIKTFATGVTELFHMFNLDICDVAAQTCHELRVLVSRIADTIDTIHRSERILEVDSVDSFYDFYPLQNYFDTLELFWTSVHRATKVRDYYVMPIQSINAAKIIDTVRELRAGIHISTRSLRAFVPLVRLGREQEVLLASFESLEELLICLTKCELRKSHWKEISRLLASKLGDDTTPSVDSSTKLCVLLDSGILGFIDDIRRITSQARNDYHVESRLEEMKSSAKKTRFHINEVAGERLPRWVLADECFASILSLMENFVTECRSLRGMHTLGSRVLNALCEWQAAAVTTRRMLLEWKGVENLWAELQTFSVSLEWAMEHNPSRTTLGSIAQQVARAAEALETLKRILQKPQFTLFTSMVQETVPEQLAVARAAMEEVRAMSGSVLESMRIHFPRFNFVTDTQLMTFLSPHNTKALPRLLPFLYSRLCAIQVKENAVISFSTVDGSTIMASRPLLFTDEPTELWMSSFDRAVRESLLAAMRTCHDEFHSTEMDVWLTMFCSQLIVMTLRCVHTRDMRNAVMLAGVDGLIAYRSKLESVRVELCHAAGREMPVDARGNITSAVLYMLHAEEEAQCALNGDIRSVPELDATAMLQTFMEADDVVTRAIGISFSYGFEFMGNIHFSMMTPSLMERMLATMMTMNVGRTIPLLYGGAEKGQLLEAMASLFGRYLILTQCYETITMDILRPLLRGAIEVGAMLSLEGIDRISFDLAESLVQCLSLVSKAMLSDSDKGTVTLPLGLGGEPVSVTISPSFTAVSCIRSIEELPRSCLLDFRPIHLPCADFVSVVQTFLCAYGHVNDTNTVSVAFGTMYGFFHEASPSHFTESAILAVLRWTNDTVSDGGLVECLCITFASQFSSILRADDKLYHLLQWCVVHLLCPAAGDLTWKPFLASLYTTVWDPPTPALERCAQLMSYNAHLFITGPVFAGKTRLWREWVGAAPYMVFAPSLMSVEDFYGTPSRPGFLTTLATFSILPEEHYIVIESDSQSSRVFWADWPLWCRVPELHVSSLVTGLFTRVIACSRDMKHVTPALASDFSIMCLPEPTNWRLSLASYLDGSPHSEVALRVMEIILPVMLAGVRKDAARCADVSHRYAGTDLEYFVLSKRCAMLYSRLWSHFQSSTSYHSDADDVVADDRILSAQYAIFSVVWGIGLSLPAERHYLVKVALIQVEEEIAEAMDDLKILNQVLPPLGEGCPNPLELVVAPSGWRPIEEATNGGMQANWCEFSSYNPQVHAWRQNFMFPSRSLTLHAIEYLLSCGQNVMLCGLQGQGKSAVLHSVSCGQQWIGESVRCSRDVSATGIQERIAHHLALRSNGLYGPPVGRKLVVCVDDVHLCPTVETGLPLACRLFSFCEKFGSLCTPSVGYIPVTDVVFMGSTLPVAYDAVAMRACVEVHLPSLEGGELVECISTLFDAVCAKKRVDGLPRGCALYVSLAHAAYTHLLSGDVLIDKSQRAKVDILSRPDRLFEVAAKSLPNHLQLALRVADGVLQCMMSGASDTQTVDAIDSTVEMIYTDLLRLKIPEGVKSLREQLRVAHTMTMGGILGDTEPSVSATSVGDDADVGEVVVPPEVRVAMESRIAAYERTASDFEEVMLEELCWQSERAQRVSKSELSGDKTAVLSYDVSTRSILITPPSARVHKGRVTASLNALQTPAPQPLSSRPGRTSRVVGQVVSPRMKQPRESPAVYRTSWLFKQADVLIRLVQLHEVHAMFVGEPPIGHEDMLRVVCGASGAPLAIIRAKQPGYDLAAFRRDMKALLTHIYMNNVRMTIYVTNGALIVPGVLGQLDELMHTGDISQLLSLEEQVTLVRGANTTLRALRPLSRTEKAQVWRIVLQNMNFILHVRDHAEWKHLEHCYSFISHIVASISMTPTWRASVHAEVVSTILREDSSRDCDPHGALAEDVAVPTLSSDELTCIICEMYECIERKEPTATERLIEFALEVRKLRSSCLQKVLRWAYAARVLGTRGDVATEQSTADQRELKELVAELLATKQKMSIAIAQRSLVSEQNCKDTEEVQRSEKRLAEVRVVLQQLSRDVEEVQQRTDNALVTAAQRLRNAKPGVIRAMSLARMPEKGAALVQSVYAILNEDLPRGKLSPPEVWSFGLRRICKPGFNEELSALSPADITEFQPFMPVQRALSDVRYGGSLPYAQLIADFLLAFVESVRVQVVQKNITLEQIEEVQHRVAELEAQVQQLRVEAKLSAESLCTTDGIISDLESRCEALLHRQTLMGLRSERLSRYVGLVDRFSRFHHQVKVDERAVWAEGDILLLAAYNALLSVHSDAPQLMDELRNVLRAHGVATTPMLEDAFMPLLFPGHVELVDRFLTSSLPADHRIVLSTLMCRLYSRWTVICGVCDVFELYLQEFLRCECKGCVVVSAMDSALVSCIQQAMRSGEGVLVRDVFDPATARCIASLHPLVEKLNALKRSGYEPQARILFYAFGQMVEVHPKFFLLCTSASSIMRGDDLSWRDINMVTLHDTVDRDMRYERHLRHLTLTKHLADEEDGLRKQLYGQIFDFMEAHDTACHLLCLDLEYIANRGDAELQQLQQVCSEVDNIDDQITHLTLLMRSVQRKQTDVWGGLKPCLSHMAHTLELIEADKLCRCWDDRVLDPFVSRMTTLSPELLFRLSPQCFADLSLEHKHFYALVNFIESVVRSLSCGWPEPIRSLFALLCLTSVTVQSLIIPSEAGVLYSQRVELLNAEQYRILVRLLKSMVSNIDLDERTERWTPVLESGILHLYLDSTDAVLNRIASDHHGSTSPRVSGYSIPFDQSDGSVVFQLFTALFSLDMERTETLATFLYNNFLDSVKNSELPEAAGTCVDEDGKLLDSFTARSSFRQPDDLGDALSEADGMTERSVHSSSVLLQHVILFAVPLLLHTSTPLETVRALRWRASLVKCAFSWYPIRNPEDVYRLAHTVMKSTRGNPSGYAGQWIVGYVEGFDEVSMLRAGENESVEIQHQRTRSMAVAMQALVAMYAGRGANARRLVYSEGGCNRTPVTLFLVVPPSEDDRLDRAGAYRRCLHYMVTYSAQSRLLELLRNEGIFRLPVAKAPSEGQERVHQDAHMVGTQKDGISQGQRLQQEGAVRFSTKKSSRNEHSLEHLTVLLVKELCVAHTAMMERQRLYDAQWTGVFGPIPTHLASIRTEDEDLFVILHILRHWLKAHLLTSHTNTDSVVGCVSGATQSTSFNRDEGLHVAQGLEHGASARTVAERGAHNAFVMARNQRAGWRMLRSIHQSSSNTHVKKNQTHAVRTPETRLTVSELSVRTFLFPVFQRVMYLLEAWQQLHGTQRVALQWVVEKFIIAPSATDAVRYKLLDGVDSIAVVLDVEAGFEEFARTIESMRTDLAELSGDACMLAAQRSHRHLLACRILFGSCETDAAATSPKAESALRELGMEKPPPDSTDDNSLFDVLRTLSSSSSSTYSGGTLKLTSSADVDGTEADITLPPASLLLCKFEVDHLEAVHEYLSARPSVIRKGEADAVQRTLKTLRQLHDETLDGFTPNDNAPLSVWLPALLFPYLSLQLMAVHTQERRDRHLGKVADTISKSPSSPLSHLILLVAPIRLLTAEDIVLERASLSFSLQQRIQQLTQWPAHRFIWHQQKDRADRRDADTVATLSADTVVVAMRAVSLSATALMDAASQVTLSMDGWAATAIPSNLHDDPSVCRNAMFRQVVLPTVPLRSHRPLLWRSVEPGSHSPTPVPVPTPCGTPQGIIVSSLGENRFGIADKRSSHGMEAPTPSPPVFVTALDNPDAEASLPEPVVHERLSSAPFPVLYVARRLLPGDDLNSYSDVRCEHFTEPHVSEADARVCLTARPSTTRRGFTRALAYCAQPAPLELHLQVLWQERCDAGLDMASTGRESLQTEGMILPCDGAVGDAVIIE